MQATVFEFKRPAGKPIVIACSGQSNMARRDQQRQWLAPRNLMVWNYDCLFGNGELADSFVEPDTTSINYAEQLGASIAWRYKDNPIYVINISRGESGIKQWTSPTEPPEMITALKRNIASALATLKVDQLDALFWWGHESDASENGDFRTGEFAAHVKHLISSLDKESWSNNSSFPVGFHKIANACHRFAPTINFTLEDIARTASKRFSVFDTANLSFDDGIHLNADAKMAVANGVYIGKYTCDLALQETRENLLKDSDLCANKLHIKTGEQREDILNGEALAGQVVTFSVQNVTSPVRVDIGGVGFYFNTKDERQYQPYYIRPLLVDAVRIVITPLSERDCSLESIKLEIGHGYT